VLWRKQFVLGDDRKTTQETQPTTSKAVHKAITYIDQGRRRRRRRRQLLFVSVGLVVNELDSRVE